LMVQYMSDDFETNYYDCANKLFIKTKQKIIQINFQNCDKS
jgi:hypothetical protein